MTPLLVALLFGPTPTPPSQPLPVSKGGTGRSSLACSYGQYLTSDGDIFSCGAPPDTTRGAAPLYVDGGYVFCAPATGSTAGCVSASGQQNLGATFIFNAEPSFAANVSYASGLAASADFYYGIATGGPVFPNANGNSLPLFGRRLDGVAGVYVGAQHWIDGGVMFGVNLPVCGFSSQPMFAVTTDGVLFGAQADRACGSSGNLRQGALIHQGGVAGQISMTAANNLSLTFTGNLSGNHTAWESGGNRPVAANYNPAYNSTVVCAEPDAGTYFCYAGVHGAVIASTVEEMKQGLIFQVDNVDRASGNHVFYVSYWGSFGQNDQIPYSAFPSASAAPMILTSEGQYRYGFDGELAHDRVVLGDYTTGKWRTRETNPDGGVEWLYLVDSNDPIPTTQLSGTVTDAQLASDYSGVGTCTSEVVKGLVANDGPLCGKVSLTTEVSGLLPIASGGNGTAPAADDQVLVSASTATGTWRTLPDCVDTGGNHLNYTASSNTFSCGTSSSGAGGSGNFLETEVDFGAAPGGDIASVVVTGQTWVTTTSKLDCSVSLAATSDRAEGVEDALLEGIRVSWHTRVLATGFTVIAHAPTGRAQGKFKVHCTGGG